MRRKITESENPDFSSLPDLTAQQQEFVRHILEGMTASDAYRKSYSTDNMKAESIWVEASRLRSHPNVALWLSAARKACLGRASVTLEGHLAELERLKEIALDTGNVGAAVQAEQLKGKASGLYTEQFRDVTRDPDDIRSDIQALLKANPELAKLIPHATEH